MSFNSLIVLTTLCHFCYNDLIFSNNCPLFPLNKVRLHWTTMLKKHNNIYTIRFPDCPFSYVHDCLSMPFVKSLHKVHIKSVSCRRCCHDNKCGRPSATISHFHRSPTLPGFCPLIFYLPIPSGHFRLFSDRNFPSLFLTLVFSLIVFYFNLIIFILLFKMHQATWQQP